MPKILGYSDAYRLLLEGAHALSQVEANGMRLDIAYLDRMIDETGQKIEDIESKLREDEVWRTWKKAYGSNANFDSGEQLGHVIFDLMGVECTSRTEPSAKHPNGRPKTDEDALEAVDFPFLKSLINLRKLKKARATNLIGLKREQVNGILRPNFNLNTVISYRSSASDPNSQNWPVRDERLAKLVRRAFIPRDENHIFLEIDLSGAEVRVSACYHQDPTMISYIERGHDYHKDLAMQCYLLEESQVVKKVRNTAKGMFVFASFYGDWYVQICQNLWYAIDTDKLVTAEGVGLKEHLKRKGIKKLGDLGKIPVPGSFEELIKKVYDDFWGKRFPVYSQWKLDWWESYLKKGYCQSHTGFVYRGVYEKNKIINYPIQGSSFHCLLWSLIQINNWLQEKKMRSMIIGQIHDSIIMDVHKDEFDDVLAKSCQVMLKDIREEWSWLIVPLDLEAEGSPSNWYEKEKIKLPSL